MCSLLVSASRCVVSKTWINDHPFRLRRRSRPRDHSPHPTCPTRISPGVLPPRHFALLPPSAPPNACTDIREAAHTSDMSRLDAHWVASWKQKNDGWRVRVHPRSYAGEKSATWHSAEKSRPCTMQRQIANDISDLTRFGSNLQYGEISLSWLNHLQQRTPTFLPARPSRTPHHQTTAPRHQVPTPTPQPRNTRTKPLSPRTALPRITPAPLRPDESPRALPQAQTLQNTRDIPPRSKIPPTLPFHRAPEKHNSTSSSQMEPAPVPTSMYYHAPPSPLCTLRRHFAANRPTRPGSSRRPSCTQRGSLTKLGDCPMADRAALSNRRVPPQRSWFLVPASPAFSATRSDSVS